MPKRSTRPVIEVLQATSVVLIIVTTPALTMSPLSAQTRGAPPLTGNPTPGTPQPATPNLADRITLTGCLQAAPAPPGSSTRPAVGAGEPSDARFILTSARRERRVPPGAGTSSVAASATSDTYRLAAIDSALSPFVGTRVEISGQVETSTSDAAQASGAKAPILRVEFVQKLAPRCS